MSDHAVVDVTIPSLDGEAMRHAKERQDSLTKPAGSLGRLEELSIALAGMTGRLDARLDDRVVFTLAADHGVAAEGVSAYPPEVTPQMVLNFLHGGAAINVLARVARARIVVADLGVDADMPDHPQLRVLKVRRGTASITRGPAMAVAEALQAIESGRRLVMEEAGKGLDVACTGDMGIGNTTAAAAIICALTGLDPIDVVGRGTGVDDAGLGRKREAVRRALEVNAASIARGPVEALAAVGGLEIAGLTGVILEAASRRIPVVIDGFISGAAALVAASIASAATGYMIASHRSQELGHGAALRALGVDPLLDLGLRLGEGTGAVLALFLLDAAVAVLNGMATFEEAGVSEQEGKSAPAADVAGGKGASHNRRTTE
jgi:nicotinate-nucleotide--dimethylbenzimidazole phosphoribosyltransferase